MKTTTQVSLYDLMAEDLDVWVKRNNKFGLDIEIDDENGKPVMSEEGIHPFAAESFANFCRQFLSAYDKAMLKEVA